MSEQHKISQHNLGLPRRRFILTAALSSAALIPSISANASAMPSELLLLPTPADALVDIMSFISEIERGILQKYYIIVGKLTGKVADKYDELKKMVIDFENMIPELKVSTDISYMRGNADIGQTSALYINNLATGDVASINTHLALINLTSNNLKNLVVNYKEQQGSLTLPPQAVIKLREIFQKILDLNEPVEEMKKASTMLTKVSNDLRCNIRTIESSISEAIRLLVAAELKQVPTSGNPPGTSALDEANQLRNQAIEKITDAKDVLSALNNYTPPKEFQEYLKENNLQAQNNAPPPSNDDAIHPALLKGLLEGAEKWIEEDKKGLPQGGHHRDSSIKFVAANLSLPLGWFDLWYAIRKVLEELIPDATTGRTWQLWGRKKLLSWYTEDEQYNYFYALLPKLNPPSRKALVKDEYKKDRGDAARRLAEL